MSRQNPTVIIALGGNALSQKMNQVIYQNNLLIPETV